jgi:hypothetical protein
MLKRLKRSSNRTGIICPTWFSTKFNEQNKNTQPGPDIAVNSVHADQNHIRASFVVANTFCMTIAYGALASSGYPMGTHAPSLVQRAPVLVLLLLTFPLATSRTFARSHTEHEWKARWEAERERAVVAEAEVLRLQAGLPQVRLADTALQLAEVKASHVDPRNRGPPDYTELPRCETLFFVCLNDPQSVS